MVFLKYKNYKDLVFYFNQPIIYKLISYLINNLNHFLDFFPDFLEETLLTDFVELFEAEMAF
jgi:hypothetical protein